MKEAKQPRVSVDLGECAHTHISRHDSGAATSQGCWGLVIEAEVRPARLSLTPHHRVNIGHVSPILRRLTDR